MDQCQNASLAKLPLPYERAIYKATSPQALLNLSTSSRFFQEQREIIFNPADTGSQTKARTLQSIAWTIHPCSRALKQPVQDFPSSQPQGARKGGTASTSISLQDKIHHICSETTKMYLLILSLFPCSSPHRALLCPGRHEIVFSTSTSALLLAKEGPRLFHCFASVTHVFYPLHRWPQPSFSLSFKQQYPGFVGVLPRAWSCPSALQQLKDSPCQSRSWGRPRKAKRSFSKGAEAPGH